METEPTAASKAVETDLMLRERTVRGRRWADG